MTEPKGSVISELPMMRHSESISTLIVATQKEVGERLKAFLKNNRPFYPTDNYGCVLNKKKDQGSEHSHTSAPGLLKSESKSSHISIKTLKMDFFDKEISKLHNAPHPNIQTPSPVNNKHKLIF